tara:strand:+ start:797 stop:1141 length:345 start_codon:yes stop_codon:yes gene_type:complete
MISKFLTYFLILFSQTASAEENHYYSGEEVEICEQPSQITHRSDLRGEPYFITFGESYPNSYMTIVIWSNDLKNLEINPISYFVSNNVCVVGEVTIFRSMPQITLSQPSQIREQ